MRVLLALGIILALITSATAAKRYANHRQIVDDYHRLCPNFVDNEYYGAPRAVIKKWCRKVAAYMRKTGDLPSYRPERKPGSKPPARVKPAKGLQSFNCVHLGNC